jgi:hypothetical protein
VVSVSLADQQGVLVRRDERAFGQNELDIGGEPDIVLGRLDLPSLGRALRAGELTEIRDEAEPQTD